VSGVAGAAPVDRCLATASQMAAAPKPRIIEFAVSATRDA
jgi:hypothetical protein